MIDFHWDRISTPLRFYPPRLSEKFRCEIWFPNWLLSSPVFYRAEPCVSMSQRRRGQRGIGFEVFLLHFQRLLVSSQVLSGSRLLCQDVEGRRQCRSCGSDDLGTIRSEFQMRFLLGILHTFFLNISCLVSWSIPIHASKVHPATWGTSTLSKRELSEIIIISSYAGRMRALEMGIYSLLSNVSLNAKYSASHSAFSSVVLGRSERLVTDVIRAMRARVVKWKNVVVVEPRRIFPTVSRSLCWIRPTGQWEARLRPPVPRIALTVTREGQERADFVPHWRKAVRCLKLIPVDVCW